MSLLPSCDIRSSSAGFLLIIVHEGPSSHTAAMLDFKPYLRRPISTLVAVASDPLETGLRFLEQYSASREGRTPADLYVPDEDWELRLQRHLSVPSAIETSSEFWSLWRNVVDEMEAKGIRPGPESFKGWNDGDAAFVRAIWYLVRNLRAQTVVETGVAHGVTSRFILQALERNGSGHLWSIDRPPMEREWRRQIGIAVDDQLGLAGPTSADQVDAIYPN